LMITRTPLQNDYAAVQALQNAAQQRSHLELTNYHGMYADEEASSSEESEEEDNDNYRSNRYVDDEAAESRHGSNGGSDLVDDAAEGVANPDHVAPENFSGSHPGSTGTLSEISWVDLNLDNLVDYPDLDDLSKWESEEFGRNS
jgi:hypothetical protein